MTGQDFYQKRVMVACEFSGRVRNAFSKLGHDAWSCDFLSSETPGNHIKGDVRDIDLTVWDIVICHPPCTYLTCANNRNWSKFHEEQEEAISFVKWLLEWPTDCLALENPVGVLSTRIRKPDQIISPFMFGSPVSKRTCLWLKGLPCLVPSYPCKPVCCFTDNFRSSPRRSLYRSRTDKMVASSMAQQWGSL